MKLVFIGPEVYHLNIVIYLKKLIVIFMGDWRKESKYIFNNGEAFNLVLKLNLISPGFQMF